MNDKDTVVVPRQREFVSKLSAALLAAYKANGGIAAIARRAHGAALIRNIATLEAAEVFADLAAAPSTSVREGVVSQSDAIRELGIGFARWSHQAGQAGLFRTMHAMNEAARVFGEEATAALVPSTDEGKRHG